MAFQPIYGYSGNHPVLDFAGTSPVCMESPNPHADWSYANLFSPHNCTFSVSPGEVLVNSSVTGETGFSIGIDIFLTYTGTRTINFSISKSADCRFANANGGCRVNGTGYYGTFYVDEVTPTTMAVPYYRYRLRFAFGGQGYYLGTTYPWGKLSISFS